MGPSSICEHCGKKFKVFTKRRKCTHCHIQLCRGCIEPHVKERHPNVTVTASASNVSEGSYVEDDDEIHFQSPLSASRNNSSSTFATTTSTTQRKSTTTVSRSSKTTTETSVDLLDDLGNDVVDIEENEDDEEDDGNDDDLLLGGYNRRGSMEEEETQYREFTQLQQAIGQWAKAEIEIKRQQRFVKQNKRVYATKPVPNFGSTRAYQQRELFVVSYAVFVTIAVWAMFALVMAIFMRVLHRTLAVVGVTA